MRWTCAFLVLGLVACGDDGGSGIDAVSTTPITVTISGIASSIGLGGRTPQADVKIDVFARSDDSMIATTMTDANGMFTITQMSNGPVDAYLKATKATFKDSYLYPPGPVAENFENVPVLMLTPSTWKDQVTELLLGEMQDPGNGWIGLIVQDKLTAPTTPVMGATVTTSPAGAPVHYNGAGTDPFPNQNATSTAMDGIAYAVNVPAGNVTVSAQKTGLTFKSHSVNARPDQITLTLIIQ